jgi:hypothetical protein
VTTFNPAGLAAIGIVVMQGSIALSGIGAIARVSALATGAGLIVLAAAMSAAWLPRGVASQVALIAGLGAFGFEALSLFNAHLVFEPRGVIFRLICYVLILSGLLIGIGNGGGRFLIESTWTTTLMVAIIVITAPITLNALQGVVQAEGTRGGFDESSPVALGFISGTLAVAA